MFDFDTPQRNENTIKSLERARDIAQLNDFNEIKRKLSAESLLENAVGEVQKLFETELRELNLEQGEWEMFAVLWLYDEDTAIHCLETYKIARVKVTEPLGSGGPILKEHFELGGVTLETFYRACLFHDIGKVEVPRSLLNNNQNEETCAHAICIKLRGIKDPTQELANILQEDISRIASRGTNPEDVETIRQRLEEKRIRAHDLPTDYLLDEKDMVQVRVLLAKYPELALTEHSPLSHLIGIHEFVSERILREAGMEKAGVLAGSHHTKREGQETDHEIARESIRVLALLADILSASDIIQALESKRPYKEAYTLLKTLATFIDEARQRQISVPITHYIVLDHFERGQSMVPANQSGEEEMYKVKIDEFLKVTKNEAEVFFQRNM